MARCSSSCTDTTGSPPSEPVRRRRDVTDPAYPDPASGNVLEPNCSRCPALVASRECISWGNGSLDAAVMIVGEAPGAGNPEADQWRGGNWTGLAYTARHSGRMIRSTFEALGYGPDDLYVTNAVKCFPSDGEGGNREPTSAELSTCFDHLETELEQVQPAVVVTTGKHATQVVIEREGVELDGFVGSILEPIESPSFGTTVLPVLHPAYQHVWLSRLGYDRQEYRDEIGHVVAEILDGS